jgi:hypothetical protein
MKMCEVLEMEHIDKGNSIDIADPNKSYVFFFKRVPLKS